MTTKRTRALRERAVLVGVGPRDGVDYWNLDDSLDELAQLADTADADVAGVVRQHRDRPDPLTYVGKGKLSELAELAARVDANLVIFDDELSPAQQRNVERQLDLKVIDRTALILDIFARRAQSHEGRLQVALAQHEYLLPRLAGQWSHLERLGGGIGTRGPGETQIETDRRLVRRQIERLKREIGKVRDHRRLLREHRRSNGLPLFALVGYTNSGKSTLLTALSDASALVEDTLFATLDPTVRRITLGKNTEALLSDTVGFIHKLPTGLVAAFRATLEELDEADVLLHVIDISHPNRVAQASSVDEILEELGLDDKPRIAVLNKVDRLAGGSWSESRVVRRAVRELVAEETPDVPVVLVSAAKRMGLADLLETMQTLTIMSMRPVDVVLPYNRGDLLNVMHQRGVLEFVEHGADGVHIRGRAQPSLAGALAPYKTARDSEGVD